MGSRPIFQSGKFQTQILKERRSAKRISHVLLRLTFQFMTIYVTNLQNLEFKQKTKKWLPQRKKNCHILKNSVKCQNSVKKRITRRNKKKNKFRWSWQKDNHITNKFCWWKAIYVSKIFRFNGHCSKCRKSIFLFNFHNKPKMERNTKMWIFVNLLTKLRFKMWSFLYKTN